MNQDDPVEQPDRLFVLELAKQTKGKQKTSRFRTNNKKLYCTKVQKNKNYFKRRKAANSAEQNTIKTCKKVLTTKRK